MTPEERFEKIEENHLALQNVVLKIAEQQIRFVEETRRYFGDNDALLKNVIRQSEMRSERLEAKIEQIGDRLNEFVRNSDIRFERLETKMEEVENKLNGLIDIVGRWYKRNGAQ
jgi:hypothetical protein